MFAVIEIVWVVLKFVVVIVYRTIHGCVDVAIDIHAFCNLHYGAIAMPVSPDLLKVPPLGAMGE